jgi:hypothetical protein
VAVLYADQPEVALRHYRRLLQQSAGGGAGGGGASAELWTDLGLATFFGGQLDLSSPCFERALACADPYLPVHYATTNLLPFLQRGDEAPVLPGSVVVLSGVMTLELLGRAIDKPSTPVNLSVGVNTNHIASMAREMTGVATGVMNQIREDIQNMPIVIPAPNVTVEAIMPEVRSAAPVVNITNEVPAAQVTVVDNHPTRAVQKVERDANDEIVQTVTTFER